MEILRDRHMGFAFVFFRSFTVKSLLFLVVENAFAASPSFE